MAQKKAEGTTSSGSYRKPPVEYQFRKGKSGNPSGRPKNAAAQTVFAPLGGGVTDRVGAMALAEATRIVTVREGGQVTEIPAVQALFRTMFRAAAQGDTKAARQLLEVLTRTENARVGAAIESLQHAARYQEKYGPIFERHERAGVEPPDVYPHPDDVIINHKTGEVIIDGPVTKEQAGARIAVRGEAYRSLRRYFDVQDALEKDPRNLNLKREFKRLKQLFDFLKIENERNIRHEVQRRSRQAAHPGPLAKTDGDKGRS